MNTNLNINLILPIVFFFLGVVAGYILHDMIKKTLDFDEMNSKNLLLVSVVIIWFIGMILSWINPVLVVPMPVHLLMGSIVGFFFYRPPTGDKK